MNLIIEAIIMSFTMGAILGGAVALSLKSSKYWDSRTSSEGSRKPVPVRNEAHPQVRRGHR